LALISVSFAVQLNGGITTEWFLSGLIGDELRSTFTGPIAMSFEPGSDTLYVLYANLTAPNREAIIAAYDLQSLVGRFPLDQEGLPVGLFNQGQVPVINEVPYEIVNASTVLTGLTINAANNFLILGQQPDFVDVDYLAFNPALGALQPVVYTLNDNFESIIGQIVGNEPMTYLVSGFDYDPKEDAFWVTDPFSSALYLTIISCCQERRPPVAPENRWVQQLAVRRGVGLQYGLRGPTNIFTRSIDEHDRDHDREHGPSGNVRYNPIAIPSFGQPQDVAYDSSTDTVWVVNNFPTTSLLQLTPSMVVLEHYNLESVTGGLKDANAIAVNKDYVVVGFFNEGYIAVFENPNNNGHKRELVHVALKTREQLDKQQADAELEKEKQAALEKSAAHAAKTSVRKGTKSHFH